MLSVTNSFRALVPSWYRAPILQRSVVRSAANLTRYTVAEITGADRSPPLCRVRWACMVALRQRGLSLPQIGRQMGGRDHTTVMHGLARAAEIAPGDDAFAALIDALVTV